MWPINRGLCIKQLKKFAAPGVEGPVRMLRGEQVMRGHLPGQKRANEDPPLPVLPARIQPQTFDDVERGLFDWLPKIQNVRQWSVDNRLNEFEQFVDSAKQIFAKSNLTDFELKVIRKRRNDELLHKATSRKRIRSTYSEASGLPKEDAERVIAEKQEKEERSTTIT